MKKLFLIALLSVASFGQTFDSQTAAAQTSITNLQTAAEAKVAADSQQISSLAQQVLGLTSANASQAQQISALGAINTSQAAQIQTLQSTFTWRGMDWVAWQTNCAAQVGGSGKGIGTQGLAPGAWFAITPTPPALGTSNYFDCYYTWDAAPDESKSRFRLTIPWTLPTLADAGASQALEMEIRQVLPGGMMGVWAVQMNFAGNQLRIYDHVRKWFSTGVAQPRFTPGATYTVTLEGHRDGASVCYDAITVNAARTASSYCYPMWDENWRPMMRVAGQLDGNGSGTPYKANRGATAFTAW